MNCLGCGKAITLLHDDVETPSDAVVFRSYGGFGSTVWDSLYNDYLLVHVCDECLVARAACVLRGARVERPSDTTYVPWDPAVTG